MTVCYGVLNIEQIAIETVTAYEEARGWRVESVEKENRGFDLISRRSHPDCICDILKDGDSALWALTSC